MELGSYQLRIRAAALQRIALSINEFLRDMQDVDDDSLPADVGVTLMRAGEALELGIALVCDGRDQLTWMASEPSMEKGLNTGEGS